MAPSPRSRSRPLRRLNGPQDCIAEIRERYKARRDVLVDGLRQAGWEIPSPEATMFAWAPIPEAFRAIGSLAFSKLLLERANVAVSPGVGFGEYGEGFVRIAWSRTASGCARRRATSRRSCPAATTSPNYVAATTQRAA